MRSSTFVSAFGLIEEPSGLAHAIAVIQASAKGSYCGPPSELVLASTAVATLVQEAGDALMIGWIKPREKHCSIMTINGANFGNGLLASSRSIGWVG